MTDLQKIEIDFIEPRTGRVAVSLSEFARSEFNGETNSYTYSHDMQETEPWATVDSIDVPVDGDSFDLWFASGACKQAVPGDSLIFVRASVAETLKSARV